MTAVGCCARLLGGLVMGAVLIGGCTRGGIHRWHPNWYSLDQDIRLGERLSKDVEEEITVLRHASLRQLLEGMGQRLLTAPPDPAFLNFPYSFKAVDSPEINAFALPGGPIYVNSGLITLLDSEDQLAAVIAHEMSHVAARHTTEMLTTVNASNFLLLVAFTVVPVPIPTVGFEGARLAYILGLLKYSRGKEREADELGAQLMWSAGYDPQQMVTVFRRLQEERERAPSLFERLFSSHPASGDRVEDVQTQVALLGPPPTPQDLQPTVPYGQIREMFAKD